MGLGSALRRRLANGRRDQGEEHHMVSLKAVVAAMAAVLLSCQVLSAQPVPVRKVHAYEGARRPAAQVATVFGRMLFGPLRYTFICEVDGKSYRATFATSVCPSVMYLVPGNHALKINHSAGIAGGEGSAQIRAEAGRTYEIEVGPAVSMRATFRVKELPGGFGLTYKDVMPGAFTGSRTNSRIDPAAD
jgi:hypothetical protein